MIIKMIRLILFFFVLLLIPSQVLAVCPVCSVVVTSGVGLSRYLGIDDTISGIWLGGLIISLAFWGIDWLKKKNITKFFPLGIISIFILAYLMVLLPLYWAKFFTSCETLWGQNKLLIGIIFGSLVFLMSVLFHNFLKKKNKDKVYFPFQKVIIPVLSLVILSIIFYLITNC